MKVCMCCLLFFISDTTLHNNKYCTFLLKRVKRQNSSVVWQLLETMQHSVYTGCFSSLDFHICSVYILGIKKVTSFAVTKLIFVRNLEFLRSRSANNVFHEPENCLCSHRTEQ